MRDKPESNTTKPAPWDESNDPWKIRNNKGRARPSERNLGAFFPEGFGTLGDLGHIEANNRARYTIVRRRWASRGERIADESWRTCNGGPGWRTRSPYRSSQCSCCSSSAGHAASQVSDPTDIDALSEAPSDITPEEMKGLKRLEIPIESLKRPFFQWPPSGV